MIGGQLSVLCPVETLEFGSPIRAPGMGYFQSGGVSVQTADGWRVRGWAAGYLLGR